MNRVAQLAATLALLGLTVYVVGAENLWTHLSVVNAWWLFPALMLTVPQYVLSAWRWAYTANHLGACLEFRTALSRYYLAGLMNSTLPSGLLGEAMKVWVHGRALQSQNHQPFQNALHAVVIERSLGQLTLVSVLGATVLFAGYTRLISGQALGLFLFALTAVAAVLGVSYVLSRHNAVSANAENLLTTATALARDLRDALWPAQRLVTQVLTSVLIVATYIAVFVCAAFAVNVEIPLTAVLICTLVSLCSMTIPLSVGGFGAREAAAATMWGFFGGEPAEGLAVAVVYGAINLAASLPGLWCCAGLDRASLARGRSSA